MSPAQSVQAFAAFDHLATMIAVVSESGQCLFANASFENVLGLSRRSVQRGSLFEWFVDAQRLRDTVGAVSRNEFSTSRLEALLRRPGAGHLEPLPVHVIVNQMEASRFVVIELVEIEQQTRQDREERALDQAQVTKELIRNLAHEIKNPLGGIRGAAQLLEMEVESRALHEYTQVIISEADRLQALVERIAEGDAMITLRTRIARQVTLGKQRYRLALDLHIQDNGPGVPESIRERIFYPLVSGRDGGSGLGLTLAQTFVQQHRGTVECESDPGRTIFKIVIPLP